MAPRGKRPWLRERDRARAAAHGATLLGMGYERAPRSALVSSAEGDASANGAKGANGAEGDLCASNEAVVSNTRSAPVNLRNAGKEMKARRNAGRWHDGVQANDERLQDISSLL